MIFIFSAVRKIFWLSCFSIGLLFVLIYLIRANEALVEYSDPVSPNRVEQAKKSLHNIAHELNNSVGEVKFYFNQQQVDAIMAVVSYTLPNTHFRTNLSEHAVNLAATTQFKTPYFIQYLNFQCVLSPSENRLTINSCKLGQLSLPKWVVSWLFKRALLSVFEEELADNVLNLIQKAELTDTDIHITLFIKEGMKQDVLTALHNNTPTDGLIGESFKVKIDTQVVHLYLTELQQLIKTSSGQPHAQSLSFYIGQLFSLAQLRASLTDAASENQAALWALAITFGNKRFGHFVGIPRKELDQLKRPAVSLERRGDLVLHFLYSAVLERLVKLNMGLKVGELKELLDTNKGGSGFSFADLAADKSGLAFAHYILVQPVKAQAKLAGTNNESLFFPSISGLVEGLTEAEFNQTYGSTSSPTYHKVEQQIDLRISQLPLYQ